jgi:sugar phosphate isomerase/epimerase
MALGRRELMQLRRSLGIAHLTLLSVPPPVLVTIAATAGFDFVGLRVSPAAQGAFAYPMHLGSSMLAETRQRLDYHGIKVVDIEVMDLRPDSSPAQWRPALESGAALGASCLNVVASDSDAARIADTLASLVTDAVPFGIRPMLEPIPYRSVRSLRLALELARESHAGLLVDALHLHRLGSRPADLRSLDPSLFRYAQMCDAPAAPPAPIQDSSGRLTNEERRTEALRFEARNARLLPGQGGLPLRDLVAVLPARTPLSIEAPSDHMLAELGPAAFASRARQSLDQLLNSIEAR